MHKNAAAEAARWKDTLHGSDSIWEPALIARVRKGNQDAAKELVIRHQATVARIVETQLGDSNITDKEDILQKILLRLVDVLATHPRKFRSREVFIRWLILAALKELDDQLTEELFAVQQNVDTSSSDVLSFPTLSTPEEALLQQEVSGILLRGIEKILTPQERTIFLRSIEGESIAEIAGTIGQDDKTIQRSLVRIRKKLRSRARMVF